MAIEASKAARRIAKQKITLPYRTGTITLSPGEMLPLDCAVPADKEGAFETPKKKVKADGSN